MSKNPTNRKVGEVLKIEIKEGTEVIPKAVYSELARCFFSEITEFLIIKERIDRMNNSIEINYSKSKAYGLYKSAFARYIKIPKEE